MDSIDLLIHAAWVITVDENDRVLPNHSLAVRDGRIVDILPTAVAATQYRGTVEHRLDEHALIPGLINAHTHTSMTLLRGLADDLPLMDWLQNHIWPAESRWVNQEFVHDGTELALAEMIKSGITAFNDMYFFPETTAQLASNAGMRATIGLIVLDFRTVWGEDPDVYLEKGLSLHDKYRSHPLVSTAFAPHAPYTVSDEPLRRIRLYADELDIPIHMHVHETAAEVQEASDKTGKRPLERLRRLGLFSPSLLAVHMTQLTANEIEQVAGSGVQVIHCPESNLKLASGFCPVDALLSAGVNVALGTDGASSNNDLDMFGEMHTAALLAKGVAGNASAVPAGAALRMATINGARALGLDATTGSLEVGKSADAVAVHLGSIETAPIYDPVSQLVYATGRDRVKHLWVAGRHLLKDRVLTTLNEADILRRTQAWQRKIAAEA
jgi:5-methylthioadenosine/S-adenosylhomocysteine deaminase